MIHDPDNYIPRSDRNRAARYVTQRLIHDVASSLSTSDIEMILAARERVEKAQSEFNATLAQAAQKFLR